MPAGVAQVGSRLSPALGQGLGPLLLLSDALKQRRSEQLPKQAAPARRGTDSGALQQGQRSREAEQSTSAAVSAGQWTGVDEVRHQLTAGCFCCRTPLPA